MLEPSDDDFPLYLLPHHVMGRSKSFLPTSFLEAQEQLVRLTNGGVRVSCPRGGLRILSETDFEYPARFDGSSITVKAGDSILDLPVQFASVIAAVESADKGFVAIHQYQKQNRCWVFAVKNAGTNLPKVVQQLAASAALLTDVLPVADNIMHISAGRTQVYCSRRVAFVTTSRQSKNDLMSSSSGGAGRSYSTTSDMSSELGLLECLQGSPRRERSTLSHEDLPTPLEHGDKKEIEHDENEVCEEDTHWVTKFYQHAGVQTSKDDSPDDAFSLPGGAVSSLSLDDSVPMPGDDVLKELRILTLVQGSKHVLNMFGLFQMPDPGTRMPNWTLISEYCSGCSMIVYLKTHGKMSELDAKKASYGLLAALDFLHQRSVVHRDVKLDHCLLRGDHSELVLCGFGSACLLGETEEKPSSAEVGTIGYQAPETLQHNICEEPADVFSAGVVIFCSLTRKKPFGGSTPAELTKHSTIHKEVDFSRHKVFEKTAPECKQFIEQLLAKSPTGRLTAGQAIRHQWLFEVAPAVVEPEVSLTSRSDGRFADFTEPKKLSGGASSSESSHKFSASPAADNAILDPLPAPQRNAAVGSSRSGRSRSLIQTLRERTESLLPRLPFRGTVIRQYGEGGENFAPISPAQQGNRNTPREGGQRTRSVARRGLSMIRSIMPSRMSSVERSPLENRPFTSLDAN
eukprot:TRINITY_DN28765_c0_g1_i1.p1 TRINITY_DN28765_c0_g1~~TRINITY_DN28765_c0_g1_i1.p1  ORF type:complete len:686 (+),score=82.45 TRINITY_DN28765_c0_g1_i1:131-2188(+)